LGKLTVHQIQTYTYTHSMTNKLKKLRQK